MSSANRRLNAVVSQMAAAANATASNVSAAATAGGASAEATAKSSLSTHVLNTATGAPGKGVSVVLEVPDGKDWRELHSGSTDSDGRITGKQFPSLDAGVYRLTFDTGAYFGAQKIECFYPNVQVTFRVTTHPTTGKGQHFHVPCLLSPYGFTTYRGS